MDRRALGDPAGPPDRARRLGIFLTTGTAGRRRDRDARRDLRPRGLPRDLAADRLDADRLTVASPTVPPPLPTFACLWCGRSWTVRSSDDLEGFAQLCPDCLGKAGDNPFLRFRLRSALAARGAAGSAGQSPAESVPSMDRAMVDYYEARAGEYDDWYLRRGRYAHGPIHDAAWNAELD